MSSKRNFKIWKSTMDSEAGFMVTPDTAIMAGSKDAFVVVHKGGTTISGPITFLTTSEQKRSGGLFVEMPDFVKMIPGTIVTPIPQQIPFPPVQLFGTIARTMPFVLAFTT